MPDVRMVSVKRVRNLGNYENVTVELQAAIDPGEDPKAALTKLADQADSWHAERYPARASSRP